MFWMFRSPLRFAVGLVILAVFGGVVYLEDRGIIDLSEVSEQMSAPATRTAGSAQPTTRPTAQPDPARTVPTPAPIEIYTPTIEATKYATSGPSHIRFRVPAEEYDFDSGRSHIIGLDDAATEDVSIAYSRDGNEYVVEIKSPDPLETSSEDVGVFIGDVGADFCGDPRPVLTVNEPIAGAKWKPTQWFCTPFGGGGDDSVHQFPTLNE